MVDAKRDLIDLLETAPVRASIVNDRDTQVLFWNTSVRAILTNQLDALTEVVARLPDTIEASQAGCFG